MSATSRNHIALLQRRLNDGPQPGERWRHYKDNVYVIVCRSINEDTLEELVTYRDEASGWMWTRTLADWYGIVDGQPRFGIVDGHPRFTKLEGKS